eukprot:25702-Eustigmatos_ZCMA.PRE.1
MGRTACHAACYRGHTGMLKQLMNAGADPTPRDKHGRTPLDDAASKRRRNCIRLLQVSLSCHTNHL